MQTLLQVVCDGVGDPPVPNELASTTEAVRTSATYSTGA